MYNPFLENLQQSQGWVVLPGSLVSAFLSPIAGRIYDKVGIRILTIIGGSSLVLSNIGMFLFIYTQEFGWRSARIFYAVPPRAVY